MSVKQLVIEINKNANVSLSPSTIDSIVVSQHKQM